MLNGEDSAGEADAGEAVPSSSVGLLIDSDAICSACLRAEFCSSCWVVCRPALGPKMLLGDSRLTDSVVQLHRTNVDANVACKRSWVKTLLLLVLWASPGDQE